MIGDAFGLMLEQLDKGRTALREIVERDDGVFFIGGGRDYVAPFREWIAVERRALRYARGRVLDLGSGPGRVMIELQNRGLEVVGIERSPLIARIARRHGARNVKAMSVEDVDRLRAKFDSVVMYGNNFGMLGSPQKTRRLLRKLYAVTAQDARILAASLDPYRTKDRVNLDYHERNRRRGKPAGTIRIRLRYSNYVTRWFDWLFVSPAEMEELVEGTGWRISKLIEDDAPMFVAILEKD